MATISIRTDDMFESGADAIVDPVNCLGTHGAGLALEFKQRYPHAVASFTSITRERSVIPGQVPAFWSDGRPVDDWHPARPLIYFFPTKYDWRDPSKKEWISSGLITLHRQVTRHAREFNLKRIAIPALGCGYGGLDWNVVRPMIEDAMGRIEGIEALLYEPKKQPRRSWRRG
jgi:O-acetyl-ADP-ribose deacetylase (regulator of RNase III)